MILWPTKERRSFERINCGANAALFLRGGSIGHFELCNLSAGGALVEGESDVRRGHLVHLVMSFEGIQEPIGVSALIHEVRREHERLARFALTFPTVSADFEDYIQDTIVKSLQKRVPVTVGRKARSRPK